MFPNSILPEHLPQYIFMYLIFPNKISTLFNIYSLKDIFNFAKLVSRHFKFKFEPDFVHITNLVNS